MSEDILILDGKKYRLKEIPQGKETDPDLCLFDDKVLHWRNFQMKHYKKAGQKLSGNHGQAGQDVGEIRGYQKENSELKEYLTDSAEKEIEKYRKQLIAVCQEKEGKAKELYDFKQEIQKKVFEEIDKIIIQLKSEAQYFQEIRDKEISKWAKQIIDGRLGNIYRRLLSLQNIFNSNSQEGVTINRKVSEESNLTDTNRPADNRDSPLRPHKAGGESPDAQTNCSLGETNHEI